MPTQPKTAKLSRWQSYGLLLINTVVWGVVPVIAKPVFAYTTPFRFLFYRYLIAILFSLPILWHYRNQLKPSTLPSKFTTITLLELLGTTLGLSLLYFGLEKTTAIEAGLLVTTAPIFVVIAGVLFLKERQEKHEWLGLLIALVGTIFLTAWPMFTNQKQMTSVSLWGNVLILGSNIAIALYYVLAKERYKNWPKLLVTTLSFYVGALTFLVLSLFEVQWSISTLFTTVLLELQNPWVLAITSYMAVFASIIGLTTYIKGQNDIEASEASLFTYLQPLVYLPLGMLLLSEKLGWYQLIALGLIGLGIWLSSWYNRPSLRIRARRRKTV